MNEEIGKEKKAVMGEEKPREHWLSSGPIKVWGKRIGNEGLAGGASKKAMGIIASLCLLACLWVSDAMAHGFIVIDQVPIGWDRPHHWHPIRPWPRPVPRPIPNMVVLPVKSQKATVTIVDQVATTEIDSIFVNESNVQLEGTYMFPIPDTATISDFRLDMNGEMVKGRVLDRNEARTIYEGYVRRYQDPALLEYVGRKMFQARIFPIPARGERRIQIKYTETVKKDGKMLTYTYPMDTGRFNPTTMGEVVVAVKMTSRKVPIQNIYSPSHGDSVAVSKKGDREATVSYEAKNVRPDKDLTITYNLTSDDVGLSVFPFRDNRDQEGYFLMVFSPRLKVAEDQKIPPKDVMLVVDTSGSMAGEKMEQAKRALAFCVNQLNAQDRFNVITFEAAVNPWKPEIQGLTDATRKDALDFIKGIRASGGTNIHDALTTALDQLTDKSRTRIVMFMTDGLPTVGEQNMDAILRSVKKTNPTSTRIFSFGVGHDVNTHLLDLLSEQNHGLTEYVAPQEDIEVKVSNWYAKVAHPVMTDVTIEGEGVKLLDIYPRKTPDLFLGSSVILAGRYQGSGKTTIRLKGLVGTQPVTYTYEESLGAVEEDHGFVPKLWATKKVGHLLDEIRLHGQSQEIVKEIEGLGKTYGIVTPFTSFLVEEQNRPQLMRGWGFDRRESEGLAGASFANQRGALESALKEQKSGDKGFNMARKVQQYASGKDDADGLGDRQQVVVQTVGRTGYQLKETIWRPASYAGQETIKVIYGSDEYFAFANKSKRLRKSLAMGFQVIFEDEGKWYEVVPEP